MEVDNYYCIKLGLFLVKKHNQTNYALAQLYESALDFQENVRLRVRIRKLWPVNSAIENSWEDSGTSQ